MCCRGWIALLPLTLVFAAGCGGDAEPPAAESRPPEVQVSEPVSQTLTDYEVFTGRTQAINAAELRSRVTGYLEKAPFDQGEDVKKGDVLFVIQQKPFEDALRQAQAGLVSAQAAVVRAEAIYKRTLALVSTTAVSREEAEKEKGDWEVARAAVGQAEAAVAIAQQNLDWSVIRAPFDGRISRRLVDPGNDVIADNTVLASLVEVDKLYAYFDVDERTLLRIGELLPSGKVPPDAAGRFPITLGLANEKPEEFKHPGKLDFADNRVEATTGTLRMWGTFPNPTADIKPGLFVRVRMGVGKPRQALFVAEAALGSDQGRKYLYVVNKDNKVVYTPVEIGQRKDGLIAVEQGLKGGERVIVDGLQRVRPQVEVDPKLVPMPRAASQAATPVTFGR